MSQTSDAAGPCSPVPDLQFVFTPEPSHLPALRRRVRDYLGTCPLNIEQIEDIVLCLHEACTNAIRYDGVADDITVRLGYDGGKLVAEVSDKGCGFDIHAFEPPPRPDPQATGGRGLFLISCLMDEIHLDNSSGLAVRMIKHCLPAAAETDGGYRLSELVDVAELQELLDRLHAGFCCPSAIVDRESTILTASGWQDICTQFHRRHPATLAECRQSDLYIYDHLAQGQQAVTYRCPRGMIDCASPIVIDGHHLGNVFIGQVLFEKPDMEFFRQQARRFGFDEHAYLEAAARVPVVSREELARRVPFLRSLAEMVAKMGISRLRDRALNEELEARARENARLYEQQRRIAQTLQDNLIHTLPHVEGLEIGVVGRVAEEPELVGGDFSDVFLLDGTTAALVIGDVMGKGVRAAGMTETIRSTVRAFAMVDRSPAYILRKTNQLLLKHDPDSELATVLLLILNTRTGEGTYASAAHPAPVHAGPEGSRLLTTPFGVPLASFNEDYVNTLFQLEADDCLVLYTDGVTEARRGGDLFGEQRLLDAVLQARTLAAQGIAEAVANAAEAHAGRLKDDLHVVAVRRTPRG